MTRRLVGLLSSCVVLSLLAFYTGHRVYYFFAITLGGLLLFSVATCLLARAALAFTQSCTPAMATKGRNATLQIQLRNRSPFPIAYVRFLYRLPSFGNPPDERVIECSLRPFGARALACDFFCELRGFYALGVSQVTVFDLFRVFSLRFPLPAQCAVEILPIVRDTVPPLGTGARGDMQTVPNGRMEDPSTPDDIRHWREGDPLKRVHWKLSARKEEWFVRTFESPTEQQTTLLIDGRSGAHWGVSERQALLWQDQLIAYGVSLAFSLQDQSLLLLCVGQKRRALHTKPEYAFDAAFAYFAELPFDGERPIAEVYAMERGALTGGGLYLLLPRLDARLLAELATLPAGSQTMLIVCEAPDAQLAEQLALLGVRLHVLAQSEVEAA